jgi:hypothetical protein
MSYQGTGGSSLLQQLGPALLSTIQPTNPYSADVIRTNVNQAMVAPSFDYLRSRSPANAGLAYSSPSIIAAAALGSQKNIGQNLANRMMIPLNAQNANASHQLEASSVQQQLDRSLSGMGIDQQLFDLGLMNDNRMQGMSSLLQYLSPMVQEMARSY